MKEECVTVSLGGIAALVASGGFFVPVLVLAVPILRVRHTIDAATGALRGAANQTTPMLERVNTTIDNVTEDVSHVSANGANLSTVVSAAAANPLVKVAAFGYGVRKAAANRRREADEAEVREQLKQRRRRG